MHSFVSSSSRSIPYVGHRNVVGATRKITANQPHPTCLHSINHLTASTLISPGVSLNLELLLCWGTVLKERGIFWSSRMSNTVCVFDAVTQVS